MRSLRNHRDKFALIQCHSAVDYRSSSACLLSPENSRDRLLAAVNDSSRVIRGSGGTGVSRGGDFSRNYRGGSRSRGGGRGRRPRSFRNPRGDRRDRSESTSSRDFDTLPRTPDEWLVLLEKESSKAYFDFAIALCRTGLPQLEAMGTDIINLGWVAGQEFHALLVAACLSMKTGYEVHPDGTVGRRLRTRHIEEEVARVAAYIDG